jgi:hypothetical protein
MTATRGVATFCQARLGGCPRQSADDGRDAAMLRVAYAGSGRTSKRVSPKPFDIGRCFGNTVLDKFGGC